ncbi:ATP-binding protein [Streptomyces sp. NPDC085932]|uniref:ATP-binding protein n=1 Tax=Streptomyces sp. NPDC085932 TaxID=3365741 RepID=UPI0037D10344
MKTNHLFAPRKGVCVVSVGGGTSCAAPKTRPPAPGTAHRRTWAYALQHRPQAAGQARLHTRGVLADWKVDAALVDQAELVVSELVTNAVQHALPPVSLHLVHYREARTLRVEVHDGGPAFDAPAGDEPTGDDDTDEHGRGTGIIVALASANGVTTSAGHVAHWAELSTSP